MGAGLRRLKSVAGWQPSPPPSPASGRGSTALAKSQPTRKPAQQSGTSASPPLGSLSRWRERVGVRAGSEARNSYPCPPASGKGCFLAVMLGWVLSAGVGVVQAQTVYRCGNQYSQVPCVRAAVVDVGDPRTAAQEADGRRVAEMDRRLAETMRRDRLAAQNASAYAPAINLGSRVADRRGPRTRLISIGGLPAGEAYP